MRAESAFALAMLGAVLLAAMFAGILAPYDPRALTGPPASSPTAAHLLGTNEIGQDLLSVWLHGGRVSLLLGLGAAAISTTLAGLVGVLSVTWRPARWMLLAVTELALAIPALLALVLIATFIGAGTWHLIIALAAVSWPAFARIIHAQVAAAVRRDHVEAARALGASELRIIWTRLLPEALPLLWSKFLLTLRWAILMEAALGLMGVADLNRISWGSMLGGAITYPLLFVGNAWLWWALPPAATIAMLTMALAAAGQDLERQLNPRARPLVHSL